MSLRHPHKLTLLAVLLVAAAMRIVGFVTQSPPGPEHDEVANWLIDKAILAGQHGVYFTEAYGHEAGFHYWQTLFVWLVGDNLVALRAPAALMGVLSVAVTYALNKRLFGRNLALLIAALIAVLFMPVFYSRLALRAISLPVTAGLCACFFWDWLKTGQRKWLIAAALFAGLSSYTYMASRALPIFFAGWLVYITLFHRPIIAKTWRDWLSFGAIYLLVSMPLILFLQNLQTVETRISEIDAPMRALLAGDFRPVFQNGLAILAGFGFTGDPLWRQGIAQQPIFEPLFAILFYLGLGISFYRIRDIRFGFLLIWLAAGIIPSVLTVDAPSTIRMILILPILATFPIVCIEQIFAWFGFSLSRTSVLENPIVVHSYPQLSTRKGQLSTTKLKFGWLILLTLFFMVFYTGRTTRDIWRTWPQNDEVQFVWQQSLTEIGRHIDQSEQNKQIRHVAIAGWSPDTLDDPTMALVTRSQSVNRRHFGTIGNIQTLIFPLEPHTLYQPKELPIDGVLVDQFLATYKIEESDHFIAYRSAELTDFDLMGTSQRFKNPVSGNQLDFLGYQSVQSGSDQIQIITVWQVGNMPNPADPNTKLFLHLVDTDGNLLAQHDGLDAPHRFWQVGDTIVQLHTLPTDPAGAELRLGVYASAPPWQRFTLESGVDFVTLPIPENGQ